VYRHDAAVTMARCHSAGDPHVRTFDGLYYNIYTTGNFLYVRNLSYPAVEVQKVKSFKKKLNGVQLEKLTNSNTLEC